jgi:hypothetical protein
VLLEGPAEGEGQLEMLVEGPLEGEGQLEVLVEGPSKGGEGLLEGPRKGQMERLWYRRELKQGLPLERHSKLPLELYLQGQNQLDQEIHSAVVDVLPTHHSKAIHREGRVQWKHPNQRDQQNAHEVSSQRHRQVHFHQLS